MRLYNDKLFSTLQLDFYGDDIFKVMILKENAVESIYPTTDVKEFVMNKPKELWSPEEFVIERSTLEYEKHLSLFGG